MQFERLKKSYRKQIIIGGLILVCVASAITITTTRAKYKLTENIPLVRGTINYKMPDMRTIAVSISDDGTNYTETNTIPTTGYELNSSKSVCKTQNETSGIENAPKDTNITIEYKEGKINFLGVTKQRTRCYLYFDKKDEEKPVISNVTTSVTKTEINVSVTATDNEGVTEYWYQINNNTPVKGTGNTYKFTGLSAGTTYTIKVYVKDAAGNQSDTTTKSATTNKPTGSETILGNVTVKTGAPNFSQTATTNEGVYKASDGMYGGTSYYWRGAVTNNYVKFAGKCWRIIRINGDGTIRLIYDGTTCHANGTSTAESIAKASIVYNTSRDQSYYVGWTYSSAQRPSTANPQTGGTASNAKTQLESWYSSNLASYVSKIADGKYCNDRTSITSNGGSYTWTATGNTFFYGAYNRINTGAPTLSCPSGDIYSLKVGLITADEAMYAGGVYDTSNNAYYLYNGQRYWTMSPYYWDRGGYALVFRVDSNGNLNAYGVNYNCDLRPVINLRSDVTFSSGAGTQSNPYVVA